MNNKEIEEGLITSFLEHSIKKNADIDQYQKNEKNALQDQYRELSSVFESSYTLDPDHQWAQKTSKYLKELSMASPDQYKGTWTILRVYKYAAAAICIIVSLVAIYTSRQHTIIQDMGNEIAQLKSQLSTDIMHASVSQRIHAVRSSENLDQVDDHVISVLSKTLTSDPSSHVRLASVYALRIWIDHPLAQSSIIKALQEEKDPSVQIALIETIALLPDQRSDQNLEALIQRKETPSFVKDEALKNKIKFLKRL